MLLVSACMTFQRLGALLKQCAKTKSYDHGLSLHAVVIKMRLDSDLILCNHVINMYTKFNDFKAAHQVFDRMCEKNLISWSIMIAGYDQAGKPSAALELFVGMQLQPNEYIYASVISACARLSMLRGGKQVHAHAMKTGYNGVSFVYNSLVSMYMKCGLFDDAYTIFNGVTEPDSISYNAMITGCVENLQLQKGLELFKLMNQQGLHPDQFSFAAILGICSSMEDVRLGATFHCTTIKLGFDTTAFIGNVILTMYMRCSLIAEVEKAFCSIKEKDLISWNTFIVACSHCGQHTKSLLVYRVMEDNYGVRPDIFTLACVLTACAELALIRCGGQIHARLIRSKMDFDVGVGNAIINMYAKCGCMRYATCVFHCMPNRNLVSWNTVIMGLGNHGQGMVAVEFFEEMKATGIMPDSVTFIGLLAACSHAGLVDEGLAYFDSMKEVYGISPTIEHLSCLIDLLGRAGRLEEAEEYVSMSTFGNDLVIWGSLLSSCRLHGNVVVGERVARRLLELRPSTSSPYVLLSNLYASNGKWDSVAETRKMLRGCGVKKEAGHSVIEVRGIAEKFTGCDFSHAKSEEIKEILDSLNLKTRNFCV